MAQIYAGLFAEGNTDILFLQSIIQKTLEVVAFDCKGQIDIELLPLEINKSGLDFKEQVLKVSEKGIKEFGIQIICVHTDSDDQSSANVYQSKIIPSQELLYTKDEKQFCKIMVAIVPVHETEAWMLADTELLKQEIGTNKTDNELGINRLPENIANPKETIEEAIRIARADLTRKRRSDLTISDLYLPIGQSLDLDKLENLLSYQDFKNNVRSAFIKLNLLQA
jgi:Domain of unknown function (DUF4276)